MPSKYLSGDLPIAYTRFLSWVSLVLIFASITLLALFIGQTARETLLSRQRQFSYQQAEYLNRLIFRDFVLEVLKRREVVALEQPDQYEQLKWVVEASIFSQVDSVRVFGVDSRIVFSMNNQEVGQPVENIEIINHVFSSATPAYEVVSELTFTRAFFYFDLPPKSFMLRALYPMRVDKSVVSDAHLKSLEEDGPYVMGVLEVTMDITDDYRTVIRFQWLILLTCLGTCFVLFSILQHFIFKAERILLEKLQQNRTLEAELHQNEKLASMGRVIASIAHEIRNPLGIISSSAELLLKRMPEEDTSSRRVLEAMFAETCRLSKTVHDFLDFARPRDLRRAPVHVKSLFDQAIGFMEGEIAKYGVSIECDIPGDIWVEGDKDLLYRAVYNVISNALQAMEGQQGELRITCSHEQDIVVIAVKDNGPGFQPESLQKSFDPFFTTKDHGTGLGLPIVNTIITSHGGSVSLANAPEGGAVVSLHLPAPQ